MDLLIHSETTNVTFSEWKCIQLKLLSEELENSFIKNDRGECRELYFRLCAECGLHKEIKPEKYNWPWLFESDRGILQQAPDRKYTSGKKQLMICELKHLNSLFILDAETTI